MSRRLDNYSRDGKISRPRQREVEAALNYAIATLGADVALSVSNNWYSGPAITLGAGTWLILAYAHYHKATTTASRVGIRIHDGSAAVASSGAYHASLNGINLSLSCSAIVSPTVDTTYTLGMVTTVGSALAVMSAALVNNGQGNNATRISAIRIS